MNRAEKLLGQLQDEVASWLGTDFEVEAEGGWAPLMIVTHRPDGSHGSRAVFWYDRLDYRRKLDPSLGEQYAQKALREFQTTSIRTVYTPEAREEARRALEAIEAHGELK